MLVFFLLQKKLIFFFLREKRLEFGIRSPPPCLLCGLSKCLTLSRLLFVPYLLSPSTIWVTVTTLLLQIPFNSAVSAHFSPLGLEAGLGARELNITCATLELAMG